MALHSPSIRAAVLIAAAATALLSTVRAADPQAAAPATAKPALTVTLTQPERTPLARSISASGSIAAWQEAIVGAESNGWRLADVRVDVGDTVRRGQVLATFSSDLAQAELLQSQAAVAEAEATLAEATANAQRARGLQGTGALSEQQLTQFFTAERSGLARLEALRAALQVQRLRLAQAQVLAPDDGVISARSATLGAVVGSGSELFRLIRRGRLEWRAEVAATELSLIKPGQRVRVTPAGGESMSGTVRMLAPTVDAATRNGIVYVDLPGGASARAGMFARGEIDVGTGSALTLPQSAVLQREGFSYVFALGAGNKVTQGKVSVGRRAGDRIEITGGLDAAARVVASGAAFLADGDTVRVVAAPAGARPGLAASGARP